MVKNTNNPVFGKEYTVACCFSLKKEGLKMDNVFPKCVLCGKTPVLGLYDGFRLGKKFICSACEEKITETKVDCLQYQLTVQNIKKLLFAK